MLCPKCSHENANDTHFCTNCGFRLVKNGFRSFLKGFVSSPLFLSLCIVFSVAVGIEFMSAADIPSIISDYAAEYSALRMEPFVMALSVFSFAFSSAPQIILLIGLWKLYAWGKKPFLEDKVSGLGLVRAYVIISEVLSYIIYGVSIVLCGIVVIVSTLMNITSPLFSNEFGFDIGRIVLVSSFSVALVILIAFLVLTVLYYVKFRRTIKDTKRLFKTGEGSVRCSSYVSAVHYIIGGFLLLSSIPSVVTSGMTGFLASLCTGAFNLLVAIVLSQYKKELERR